MTKNDPVTVGCAAASLFYVGVLALIVIAGIVVAAAVK
jgi:hypothetical protein